MENKNLKINDAPYSSAKDLREMAQYCASNSCNDWMFC